ncbi:MAG TPA: UPF0158 family protein [Sphaerochaeta sp.]|nr:UPF0158 family protein [Sphaerochaeta sp.]
MDEQHPTYQMPHPSDTLIDAIIFAMEDQSSTFFLDLKKAAVISLEERALLLETDPSAHKDRFLRLPAWKPADGFQLMEQFVSTVRNPTLKAALAESLEQGRGVFRRFKDVLSGEAVAERRWFTFKAEQMKRVVLSWYRSEAGALSLAHLPLEPEEHYAEDLLLADFSFDTYAGPITEELQRFIDTILAELEQGDAESALGALLLRRSLVFEQPEHAILARAYDGSLIGLLLYTPIGLDTVLVPFFAVKEAYRGLGIFRLLYDTFSRQAARSSYQTVILTLAAEALNLSATFAPYQSESAVQLLTLSTEAWNRSNPSSESAYL